MRRKSGAELEQLREMRLAHLRDPAQHAYRQRSVKIVSNVLDHARQTTRRNAEYLLARNVGGCNEGARQFPSEIVGDDRRAHHQKIHAVVLDAAARRVRVVAQSRAYSRLLVRNHGSSNGPGTDQHAPLDAILVDRRSQLIGRALVIRLVRIPRREILGHMPLSRKSGSEMFLTLKPRVVRSKPYAHDCPSKQPHPACEVGLYSEEFSLSAPGGIGCDEAITPEPGKRNNWTMVSERLWYRTGEDSHDDRLEINTKVWGSGKVTNRAPSKHDRRHSGTVRDH